MIELTQIRKRNEDYSSDDVLVRPYSVRPKGNLL